MLGAVFENTILNPTKIKQGTFLKPSLPKKVFLKGMFEELGSFYYYFYKCKILE
jgi:hypothetical protein